MVWEGRLLLWHAVRLETQLGCLVHSQMTSVGFKVLLLGFPGGWWGLGLFLDKPLFMLESLSVQARHGLLHVLGT